MAVAYIFSRSTLKFAPFVYFIDERFFFLLTKQFIKKIEEPLSFHFVKDYVFRYVLVVAGILKESLRSIM